MLAALNLVFDNPIITLKITAVIIQAFACVAAAGIVSTYARSGWLAVLGSLLLIIPTDHFYMLGEFLNNFGSLTLLLWAFWCVLLSVHAQNRRFLILSIFFVIFAVASHISAGPLVLTFGFFAFAVRLAVESERPKTFLSALIGLCWLGTAGISLVARGPDWLRTLGTAHPQFPFRAPFVAEESLLLVASLATVLLILKMRRERVLRWHDYLLGAIALWGLAVTLNPFLNGSAGLSGVAGRFRSISYIQNALLVPYLIGLLWLRKPSLVPYALALLFPLFLLVGLGPLPYGLQPDTLLRRMNLISGLQANSHRLAQGSMIIAPHGDQFVVTATTHIPSQNRVPSDSSYNRVYWLLETSRAEFPDDQIIILNNRPDATMLLIDDVSLRQRWNGMHPMEKALLLRRNLILTGSYSMTPN
ncbi:MAG TPA: hypothetical protein VFZ22_14190 [Pyrinomonadaceae bacterium]|nr:hypothetical protein [Pyrinomonadaceae bacterium]